jgi:hypothetical protein
MRLDALGFSEFDETLWLERHRYPGNIGARYLFL